MCIRDRLKTALKLLVLMFLLSLSKIFIPENSILMKCRPITEKIKGEKKLIGPGKKKVIFLSWKLFREKSKIPKEKSKTPIIKEIFLFF